MKLKYYLDSAGKKTYTLKDKVSSKQTQDAHYKFIKIKSETEARTASPAYQDSE
jgi:hypothetical protein